MRRSQVILRMPVDHVVATLMMHDGTKSDVVLFVPPTEDIGHLLTSGPTFLPAVRDGRITIIARDAVASIGTPEVVVIPREDDLPVQRQSAVVTLRSGAKIEGELRFTAPAGQQRTADYLNEAEPVFAVHAAGTTYVVVKAHVAQVEET